MAGNSNVFAMAADEFDPPGMKAPAVLRTVAAAHSYTAWRDSLPLWARWTQRVADWVDARLAWRFGRPT